MSACRTMEEAIGGIHDNLESASPRDLSAFWTVAQRMLNDDRRTTEGPPPLVPQLDSIFRKTMARVDAFAPRDLAQTALALAKAAKSLGGVPRTRSDPEGGYREHLRGLLAGNGGGVDAFRSIADASALDLAGFDARCLSNLAYAYALAGRAPVLDDGTALFDRLAETSIPLLHRFKPQELSNMVWAYTGIGASHPHLFAKVADRIDSLGHLEDFKPQELSNILLAYAKAEISHLALFSKVADHIVSLRHLGQFKPQELSNVVWAFRRAGVTHAGLFDKVTDHISALTDLKTFNPQDLSNLSWTYVKAGASHPPYFTSWRITSSRSIASDRSSRRSFPT